MKPYCLLLHLWERLGKTNHVLFQFHSRRNKNGEGQAEVATYYEGDSTLIFQEQGEWKGQQNQEFKFRNAFRWSLNQFNQVITLEHLRFGKQNPTFLFHLIIAGPNSMQSLYPHLCGQDVYFGQLIAYCSSVQLKCRIQGPEKDDEICYTYS